MSSTDAGATILFAYDGSDHAKTAIAAAGANLRTDRPAVVLTVWEPLEAIPFYGAPMSGAAAGVDDAIVGQAQEVAREGAELVRAAGFDATPEVVRGDPTWSAILEAASQVRAGAIVMGTHGRTGIPALVLGSVATAVAHRSTVPVLIAPHRD